MRALEELERWRERLLDEYQHAEIIDRMDRRLLLEEYQRGRAIDQMDQQGLSMSQLVRSLAGIDASVGAMEADLARLAVVAGSALPAIVEHVALSAKVLCGIEQLLASPNETAAAERARNGSYALASAAELSASGSDALAGDWLEQAIGDLSRAVEIHQYRPEYWHLLAMAYKQHGDSEAAAKAYSRCALYAVTEAPRLAAWALLMAAAILRDDLAQPDEAASLLGKYREKLKRCAEIHLVLAIYHGDTSALARALELAPILAADAHIANVASAERDAADLCRHDDGPVVRLRRLEDSMGSLVIAAEAGGLPGLDLPMPLVLPEPGVVALLRAERHIPVAAAEARRLLDNVIAGLQQLVELSKAAETEDGNASQRLTATVATAERERAARIDEFERTTRSRIAEFHHSQASRGTEFERLRTGQRDEYEQTIRRQQQEFSQAIAQVGERFRQTTARQDEKFRRQNTPQPVVLDQQARQVIKAVSRAQNTVLSARQTFWTVDGQLRRESRLADFWTLVAPLGPRKDQLRFGEDPGDDLIQVANMWSQLTGSPTPQAAAERQAQVSALRARVANALAAAEQAEDEARQLPSPKVEWLRAVEAAERAHANKHLDAYLAELAHFRSMPAKYRDRVVVQPGWGHPLTPVAEPERDPQEEVFDRLPQANQEALRRDEHRLAQEAAWLEQAIAQLRADIEIRADLVEETERLAEQATQNTRQKLQQEQQRIKQATKDDYERKTLAIQDEHERSRRTIQEEHRQQTQKALEEHQQLMQAAQEAHEQMMRLGQEHHQRAHEAAAGADELARQKDEKASEIVHHRAVQAIEALQVYQDATTEPIRSLKSAISTATASRNRIVPSPGWATP